MPLELLRQLGNQGMPFVLKDRKDIDKLRVLRAAGMVIADIPEGENCGALVREITEQGQTAIRLNIDPINEDMLKNPI